MKKFIAMAAILAATSGSAFAQAASQNVTITATVAAFCTIDGLATGTANTASATSQITNGQVTGGALTLANAASPSVCNKASTISMSSANKGILSATPATAPFINKIDYTATANVGATQATYATIGDAAVNGTTGGATAENLVIAITTVSTPGTNYLVAANDYTDTLTVTLTPTP